MPISWRALTYFFAALCLAAVIFLAVGSVSRKETAIGVLTLTQGEIRVLPSKSGIIAEVYVRDGQAAKAGQPLVRISTQQDTDSGTIDQEIIASINVQYDALRAQLKALDASAPIERHKVEARLENQKAQLKILLGGLSAAVERLSVSQEAFEAGRILREQGIVSGDYQRQRQYDYITQKQNVDETRLRVAQLEGGVQQDTAMLAKLPNDLEQARSEILKALAALDERRFSANGDSGYVLKAKTAGKITSLQAKIGQFVDQAQPLMTLIPQRSELYAQIFVPSRAIGFIKPNQKVRLMFDAFPYQKFGAGTGIVRQVSSTVLRPEEINAAVTVKEPVYRVEVALESRIVDTFGRGTILQPGMALTADILLEDRSLLALLFEPFFAARGRI